MNATTQCVWLQGILQELRVAVDSPTVIWCDNQSEINIYTYPVQRQRTKHIEIHMHYIRSLVYDKVIALQYFPSADYVTVFGDFSPSNSKFNDFYNKANLFDKNRRFSCM